jgi:hypothetical protein
VTGDRSIRRSGISINQLKGQLSHDDRLFDPAMSLNRNNIVSAGIDAKVYTWNLEAALKEQDSDRVGVRIIYVTVQCVPFIMLSLAAYVRF